MVHHTTQPRGADTLLRKPSHCQRSRCSCPESSATWVACRWPWTTCKAPEVPSCMGLPAAGSPLCQTAPGSLGNCLTREQPCTGPFTQSIPSWLHRPACLDTPGPTTQASYLVQTAGHCTSHLSSLLGLQEAPWAEHSRPHRTAGRL